MSELREAAVEVWADLRKRGFEGIVVDALNRVTNSLNWRATARERALAAIQQEAMDFREQMIGEDDE